MRSEVNAAKLLLAARATPDGYTLLAGSVSTHSFAPLIHAKLGYDPVSNTPEEFGRFVREQLASHRQLVEKLGIRFD